MFLLLDHFLRESHTKLIKMQGTPRDAVARVRGVAV